MNYYYLIASLPYITFDSELPFSVNEFELQCEGIVTDEQLESLKGLSLLPREEYATETEDIWNQFEICLRNWIVHSRAHRTKTPPEKFIHESREFFVDMEKLVDDAFDESNPLKMAHTLDRLRWKELDRLETGHDFDYEKLVIYKLRLLILENWASLDKEEGAKAVHKVVEDLIASVGKETA